jgi:hypothetical protein
MNQSKQILFKKMAEIVETNVKDYKVDFYKYDRQMLEEYDGRFLWLVRDSGTDFIRLDVIESDLSNEEAYLDAVTSFKRDMSHRKYICDTSSSEIIEIGDYSSAIFKLLQHRKTVIRLEGLNPREILTEVRLEFHNEKDLLKRIKAHAYKFLYYNRNKGMVLVLDLETGKAYHFECQEEGQYFSLLSVG